MTQTADSAPESTNEARLRDGAFFIPPEAGFVPGTRMTLREVETYDHAKDIRRYAAPDVRFYERGKKHRVESWDRLLLTPRMICFESAERLLRLVETNPRRDATVLLVDGRHDSAVPVDEFQQYLDADTLTRIMRTADERHRRDQTGGFTVGILEAIEDAKIEQGLAEARTVLTPERIDTVQAA